MDKELDVIYEVYMGDETNEFTKQSRERIDWICEQATGDSVLDVGCSQGIASILLGRKGKNVLGIDIETESIAFANNILQQEDARVNDLVEFDAGDFLQYDFGTKKYDSILMTEILEHIVDIIPFIEKSQLLLNKNGTLIVTVPFGINDYWDHKDTYYVAKMYEALSPYYSIVEIKFFTRWIGFVCKEKANDNSSISSDIFLLKQTEETFYKLERELVDKTYELQEKLQLVNDKYKAALENYETMKEWLDGKNTTINKLQTDNEQVYQKYKATLQNYETMKEWLDGKNTTINKLQADNEQVYQKYKTALENYETAKSWVADKETNINLLNKENEKLKEIVHDLSENYEKEKKSLHQENQKLRDSLNESTFELLALKKEYQDELVIVSKDYDLVVTVLDEVNRKIHQLEMRNDYLKSEAAEYRRKLSIITDTWWGKFGIKVYKKLKRIKAKLSK